jgi:hypothetical protein
VAEILGTTVPPDSAAFLDLGIFELKNSKKIIEIDEKRLRKKWP